MIPIIGVMIGLYVITRMVELVGSNARPYVKVLAVVAAVANAIGIIALWKGGSDLSSIFGGGSPASTVSSPFTPLDTGITSPTAEATWEVTESTNPIDDSPTVVLSLDASLGRSRMGQTPTLVLRCSQKETNAYIHWADFLGSDEASVTTRIGKGQAQTRGWSLSSDKTATFYPGNSVQFIKSLLTADTLVARTTPYNESPVTAVFAIKGLAEKVGPLQTACGWK